MDRRRFLQLGLGGAALALAGPTALLRDPALAQPAPGPFGHGVASGDPLPDRVVLWTRVTPSDEATPGSGLGPPAEVAWEVAEDPDFRTVVAQGAVTTTAARDHTVKVDAAGLRPATEHWYRFRALGATSPVGRTRTAPAPGAAVERLRFGVVSCSNYEGGWFSAYRHLAARDDLDAILHLGDYLYEYGDGGYATLGVDRALDPEHEIVTLADYRRRHALYKTDPDLAALHRRYPFITTIDDHEVANNAWEHGAGNHQAAEEGDYAARKAAALQAYFEWMPLRQEGTSTRIYRRLGFGALADVFVLDERSYRSQAVHGLAEDLFVTSPVVRDLDRTMLGAAQRAWFTDGLAASTARWKVVANSVMFAPLVLADLPDLPAELEAAFAPVLGQLGVSLPLVLNGDQWDGYQAEQAALVEAFRAARGVVLLTGDIHSSWAAEIPVDAGTYLGGLGESAAVEFVTPAVTSDSFRQAIESVGVPGGEALSAALPLVAGTLAPWFKYLDPDRHGYGVFEVTPDAAQYDWHHISDRTDPQATSHPGPSWRTAAGSNRLVAAAPLGPRPDRPAAPVPPPPAEPATTTTAAPAAEVVVPDPEAAAAGRAGDRLPATGAALPLGAAAVAAAGGLLAARTARSSTRSVRDPVHQAHQNAHRSRPGGGGA